MVYYFFIFAYEYFLFYQIPAVVSRNPNKLQWFVKVNIYMYIGKLIG